MGVRSMFTSTRLCGQKQWNVRDLLTVHQPKRLGYPGLGGEDMIQRRADNLQEISYTSTTASTGAI